MPTKATNPIIQPTLTMVGASRANRPCPSICAEPTKKFHHIIDPETGYSATKLISVTIIADKAVDADAIATAVFVLGPDEGLQLIEKLENVEGLLITPDRKIIKSSGFDSCC